MVWFSGGLAPGGTGDGAEIVLVSGVQLWVYYYLTAQQRHVIGIVGCRHAALGLTLDHR